MNDKLEAIKKRFEEVQELMVAPNVMADMKRFSSLGKEYKDLEKIVHKYDEYKHVIDNIKSAKSVLETEKDEEFREMAKMELDELNPKKQVLEDELKKMLIPKDPNDSKNAILEIRGGAGGDEAAIFAGDLFRMYQRFAEQRGWKMNILDFTEGTSGGYKEIICTISGNDVYGQMKYESGVHRVQRVPTTETQGRVHTSAVTVAILPEADEVDVNIDMNELKFDVFRSSGPGGQSVNTTDSAVRITHLPTGLVVTCQDEKSQHKNKAKALNVLRARLLDQLEQEHHDKISSERKSQVGSGDRSERIRTYNFPQGRLTDHRIGLTLYKLELIMNGKLDEVIDPLIGHDQAEKLKNIE